MSERQALLSLRVRHESLAAELIEAAVGQSAKVKWTAGDARVAPGGRSLGGVRGETYCTFEVPEAAAFPLNAAILALSDRLAEQTAALADLKQQGADIEVYATADEGRRGETIEAATIAALARLSAGLAIDWYK
ncbi:MAG: hypothetical protein ACK4I0_08305 [Brevundimonas sp.]|uniref:hypothetical protein n=1 Tax=Brevundimonas sp. TaxID=1871086 RepID=UPI00391A9C61